MMDSSQASVAPLAQGQAFLGTNQHEASRGISNQASWYLGDKEKMQKNLWMRDPSSADAEPHQNQNTEGISEEPGDSI